MFVEESIWIRGGLEKADLREGMTLLDVGSSTERFRRLHQPFIDYEIFRPLRRRGVRIVHVDARRDEGVDVVCNLADPATEPEAAGLEPAHAVLASNLLEHVLDRDLVLTRIKRLTRPGGIIVVTVPNLLPVPRRPDRYDVSPHQRRAGSSLPGGPLRNPPIVHLRGRGGENLSPGSRCFLGL